MLLRRIVVGALAAFLSFAATASVRAADDGGILVFGGTGRLGSDIVNLLVKAGQDVTVFAR
ncbi:MAG: hypothetical protein KDA71_19570, partial [Planctomycetales bacterium]|nr:hypothetical protein [Planctomycetales bacterium]